MLHDSGNTLGHVWHRGKAKGKMFNHLFGFLPSWDEQYRVASVHEPRPAEMTRKILKSFLFFFFLFPKCIFFVISELFRLLISVTWGKFLVFKKIGKCLEHWFPSSSSPEVQEMMAWTSQWMWAEPAALTASFSADTLMLSVQGRLVWGSQFRKKLKHTLVRCIFKVLTQSQHAQQIPRVFHHLLELLRSPALALFQNQRWVCPSSKGNATLIEHGLLSWGNQGSLHCLLYQDIWKHEAVKKLQLLKRISQQSKH